MKELYETHLHRWRPGHEQERQHLAPGGAALDRADQEHHGEGEGQPAEVANFERGAQGVRPARPGVDRRNRVGAVRPERRGTRERHPVSDPCQSRQSRRDEGIEGCRSGSQASRIRVGAREMGVRHAPGEVGGDARIRGIEAAEGRAQTYEHDHYCQLVGDSASRRQGCSQPRRTHLETARSFIHSSVHWVKSPIRLASHHLLGPRLVISRSHFGDSRYASVADRRRRWRELSK